jgi:serpin B
MKKLILGTLVAVIVLSVIACTTPAAAGVLKSDKPRITSPSVGDADIAKLVEGNSAFAFDLYQNLRSREGNLFYSPYSLSLALAMAYAGAKGETEKEMAAALSLLLTQEKLHPAFNSLDLALATRGQGAKGKDEKGFRLRIVNDIWGQQNYSFLSQYLDVLAQNYGAGLRTLDFEKNPEQARKTINDWIFQQTEERIKDLIPEGAINELTRLVLTNAIYFNAAWQNQFKKENTSNADFHLLNGDKIIVPMMHQTESFGYLKGNGYQAIEMLYDGRELSMVILLPDQGQFDSFESSLSGRQVQSIIGQMGNKRLDLSMPKFEYDSSFSLKKALADLGMGIAFTGNADLSGIDGKKDLLIQDVVHKAFVSVDEAGTEAAAASAVIIGLTSMPPEPTRVVIDRPFIYLIRDIQTGAILFVGRLMNPSK